MSGARTLWLVPPLEGVAAAVPPETVLLGLPMIRRTVLAAWRAGFGRVVVAGADAGGSLARALEGTSAELLPSASAVPAGAVVLPWNRALRTAEVQSLARGLAGPDAGVLVVSRADWPRAERWLLDGLVKETESFMSRRFERKISLAVSRRLAGTAITPNQMTILSVVIGVAGAPFFFSSRASMQTAGALLFLLHSILDGCDGELARLKFQESRYGGVLDFWGDNVVHVAIFGAMAVGWSLSVGRSWPLTLGAAAIAGTLLSAAFVYRTTMATSREGPLFTSVTTEVNGAVSRVTDALGRRDFIYLVLALSLFGKASWFLLASAVGAPIFFLVLVALAWRRPERKST